MLGHKLSLKKSFIHNNYYFFLGQGGPVTTLDYMQSRPYPRFNQVSAQSNSENTQKFIMNMCFAENNELILYSWML